MTLPPPSRAVKPEHLVLLVSAVTALLTAVAMLAAIGLTSRADERMDEFGNATARLLAELTVEPLMRRDRMHLGVIGNRLAELEEVSGVASYDAEVTVLASTGPLEGPQYDHPVTIDDTLVGHVRVALAPEAFAAPARARNLAVVAILLLVPLLTTGGFALSRAAADGRLRRLLRRRNPAETADEPAEPDTPPAPAGDVRHYLVAVNLYNQLTLPPDQREFELSLCLELAEEVAAIYQGQVVSLPGVGVLLDLDHTDDPDRPFQVLCAAFTLSRLLQDEAPFGIYRLGAHVTEQPADEPLMLEHEAVRDTALLSALARDLAIAISATLVASLDNTARLRSRPLVNPVLDELATSGTDCRLVTDLEAPHAGMVREQAEQLRGQREATSSPSTF